ncbi:Putative oxidoreductase YteT precursor [Paenibacillus konkukensis]|uniref:Oxidoreductase YteT n=1 Tax=Paenibacillus konkukensis TaxID=2020716 RepID=A0ABY4RKD8_9BACL|nr:Gfo/Idh/MocA family oxidoreductase [Paenibacillus konkukensis]UQZ82593.1 Putative oxidoreductase YteT precursor [Paenibacillus konkukensis]
MNIGVIGYGTRIKGVIQNELKKLDPHLQIAGLVDPDPAKHEEARQAGSEQVRIFETPEAMLADMNLDGIIIGTRCSLHTSMALKVLPSGLPLFLEKPVATSLEDALRLKRGYESSGNRKTVVSFPLRVTTIVHWVKEIIDSGKIGTVEHVQAVNNVPYGNVYFQGWYRDEEETGGLFLQKATHDFDYINYVLGMQPESVAAMVSKQIFKGNKPAGLRCTECGDNKTCPESTAFRTDKLREEWAYCCFAEDTGNEDSGSALIRYESGMHVSYSQNFFARNQAAARGARFFGYKGTLEFDFYTGIIKVYMHHSTRVETYEFGGGEGHFGGDAALMRSFAGLMEGSSEKSVSPLEDGLVSALLCLKARESAATGTFQSVSWE